MRTKEERHTRTSSGWLKSAIASTGSLMSSMRRGLGNTAIARRVRTRREEAYLSNMYRSVDELPLLDFIAMVCDNNYKGLYKTPVKAKNSDLETLVYSEIYGEYIERMNGGDKCVYDNYRNMMNARAKVCILEGAMMICRTGQVPDDVKAVLRKMMVRLSGNTESDIAVLQAARDKALRDLEKAQQNVNADGDTVNIDREYFMSVLAVMSSHYKFPMQTKGMTVGEFCALFVQMNKELKNLSKLKKDGRKN